jgi:hypothetical protein
VFLELLHEIEVGSDVLTFLAPCIGQPSPGIGGEQLGSSFKHPLELALHVLGVGCSLDAEIDTVWDGHTYEVPKCVLLSLLSLLTGEPSFWTACSVICCRHVEIDVVG